MTNCGRAPAVLFLGVNNFEEYKNLVINFPFLLFYTITINEESAVAGFAREIGSPQLRCREMWEVEKYCNYIAGVRGNMNQAEKNLFMKMKNSGVHGTLC